MAPSEEGRRVGGVRVDVGAIVCPCPGAGGHPRTPPAPSHHPRSHRGGAHGCCRTEQISSTGALHRLPTAPAGVCQASPCAPRPCPAAAQRSLGSSAAVPPASPLGAAAALGGSPPGKGRWGPRRAALPRWALLGSEQAGEGCGTNPAPGRTALVSGCAHRLLSARGVYPRPREKKAAWFEESRAAGVTLSPAVLLLAEQPASPGASAPPGRGTRVAGVMAVGRERHRRKALWLLGALRELCGETRGAESVLQHPHASASAAALAQKGRAAAPRAPVQ